MTIWLSEDYVRAAPGGTGEAKCGGNYAASLLPQQEAYAKGFEQVCFLDASTNTLLEAGAGAAGSRTRAAPKVPRTLSSVRKVTGFSFAASITER